MNQPRTVTVYRSAVTGEYVTKEYADANPDTTVAETEEVVPHVGYAGGALNAAGPRANH